MNAGLFRIHIWHWERRWARRTHGQAVETREGEKKNHQAKNCRKHDVVTRPRSNLHSYWLFGETVATWPQSTERNDFNFDAILDPFSVWKYFADKNFPISARLELDAVPNASRESDASIRSNRMLSSRVPLHSVRFMITWQCWSASQQLPPSNHCTDEVDLFSKEMKWMHEIGANQSQITMKANSYTRWHRSTSTYNENNFIATGSVAMRERARGERPILLKLNNN